MMALQMLIVIFLLNPLDKRQRADSRSEGVEDEAKWIKRQDGLVICYWLFDHLRTKFHKLFLIYFMYLK